jgi:osmotically-inducible protein OsmY
MFPLKGEKMISLDEQTKQSVIDQLKWDSRVDISEIDVSVSCGTVKLKGRYHALSSVPKINEAAKNRRCPN